MLRILFVLSQLDCRPVVWGLIFCSYLALVGKGHCPFSAGCVSAWSWSVIIQTVVYGGPVKFESLYVRGCGHWNLLKVISRRGGDVQ